VSTRLLGTIVPPKHGTLSLILDNMDAADAAREPKTSKRINEMKLGLCYQQQTRE
jgi:hypothetical protein